LNGNMCHLCLHAAICVRRGRHSVDISWVNVWYQQLTIMGHLLGVMSHGTLYICCSIRSQLLDCKVHWQEFANVLYPAPGAELYILGTTKYFLHE
jgi:hypothetical protein